MAHSRSEIPPRSYLAVSSGEERGTAFSQVTDDSPEWDASNSITCN